MDTKLKERLRKLLAYGGYREDEPLSRHTTFRIGGRADVFLQPGNEPELIETLSVLRETGVPYFLLGGGSNTLFPDGGFRGAVVSVRRMEEVSVTGRGLRAACGTALSRLAVQALRAGLSGLEELSGIPGSVGGAVRMNAGCYGREMKDIVSGVRVLRGGETLEAGGDALKFSYRRADFLRPDDVVLSAEFTLTEKDPFEIQAAMREYAACRASKQPLGVPSAGSTFKRPENGYAAGLIERAGLKGCRIGDAAVSEKHAGFVVNLGNANSEDVRKLIDYIQKTVYNRFNVKLEPEVVLAP